MCLRNPYYIEHKKRQYYSDAINSAARWDLWSLCHTHRHALHAMEYRHLPRCTSGTEKIVVTLGGAAENRINVLARVTAALNTNLECVTTELDETQDMLLDAHVRIRQLEAQLAGRAPPPPQEEMPDKGHADGA